MLEIENRDPFLWTYPVLHKILFSIVVNSQEDSLVITDHCCVRTQLVVYTLSTIVQVMQPSPLWPCMCHMLGGECLQDFKLYAGPCCELVPWTGVPR